MTKLMAVWFCILKFIRKIEENGMKRFISAVLSLCMVWGCLAVGTPTARAVMESAPPGVVTGAEDENSYTDFSKFVDVRGHWAESNLQWAVQNGMMNGTSATTMSPNGDITRAQMATIVVRAFGATKAADISMFADIKKEDWCYDYIARAVQMGCLSGFGNAISPDEKVTRQEVAITLVKAAGYPISSSGNLSQFSDGATVDSWAAPYLSTAVSNGLLAGYSDGRIGAKDKVTRAQFVVMLQRVASAYMTPTATYTSKQVNGSLMVGVGNISLDNMTITGNLFLTDGVGTGDITLNGTTVGGTIYVRGTGPNTVKLSARSHASSVVLCNPNNAVRLDVDSSSSISGVRVHEAVGSVTLTGDVGNVTLLTGKAPLKLSGAIVNNLSVDAKLASITVDKGSKIGDIRLAPAATGTTLELQGSAKSLDVDALDCTVDIKGTIDSLSFGSTGDNCKLTLSKDCVIKNLDIDADDLKLSLAGKLTKVNVSGDDCDVTFASGTEITTLNITGEDSHVSLANSATANTVNIDGDGNEFTVESGAKVTKLYTEGNHLVLNGRGEVKRIQVTKGKNIEIEIPGAIVYNKGGSNVEVGDLTISKGSTVTISSNGSSTEEYDEQKKEEQSRPSPTPNPNPTPTPTPTPTPPPVVVDPMPFDMSLEYPVSAQPSDFGYNSAYSLDSFGSGLGYNSSTGELTGTVKFQDEFRWYLDSATNGQYATGYYVPLVLRAGITSSAGELVVGNARFDSSVVSSGTGYNGNWIVYLALDPQQVADANGKKLITVSYDPDGTGSIYATETCVVDVSGVSFSGGTADNSGYGDITAVPGIDGAETAVCTVDGSAEASPNTYSFTLTTTSLLETRNSDGRFGYWTGLRIPAFDDVINASGVVTSPSGRTDEVIFNIVTDEAGDRYVNWVFNVSERTESVTKWTLSLTWNDANGVSSHTSVVLVADVSGCVLAGETPAPDKTPVVSELGISIVTDDDIRDSYGLITDYVYNYRLAGAAIAGTVVKASVPDSNTPGYYFPVKVTGNFVVESNLMIDSTLVGSVQAGQGSSAILLLPLTTVGSGAADIKLIVTPTAGAGTYSNVTLTINAANITTAQNFIALSETLPTAALAGHEISSLITNPEYSLFNNLLTVKGDVAKQVSPNDFGFEGSVCWVAPVSMRIRTDISAWKLYVKVGSKIVGTYTPEDLVGDSLNIGVPLAIDGSRYDQAILELVDCTNSPEVFLTSTAIFSEAALTDFVEENVPPEA